MKNKLYILIVLFISFFTMNIVKASDFLTFDKTYDYSTEITDATNILSTQEKYIILNNNYNSTEIITTDKTFTNQEKKLFANLTNASIIKYNDNLIMVGIENNVLKVYQLDYNLKVLNQKETNYFIDQNSELYLYINDSKIYIMPLENEVLYSTIIYEIDTNLNIAEKKLSSYDSKFLKETLKGDYYLIHNNDKNNNGRISHYYKTTYTREYRIIVGDSSNEQYNETTGFDYKANLVIINQDDKEIINQEFAEYNKFLDVEIIKDKIVILATKDEKNYLLIYDFSGQEINRIELLSNYKNQLVQNTKLFKVDNKLFVYSINPADSSYNTKVFTVYNFECEIIATENQNGTISVTQNANPYDVISPKITTNSGFEIESIIIEDSQGNRIPLVANEFIMPENDAYISVNYKATVANPETVDIIFFVVIIAISVMATGIHLYKKLHWLK